MAAEKRKVKKWGWKTLLALLGLAAAGAFGFFSIFNTVRVTAAEPSLSENEANEAASVTITDAELEQLKAEQQEAQEDLYSNAFAKQSEHEGLTDEQ